MCRWRPRRQSQLACLSFRRFQIRRPAAVPGAGGLGAGAAGACAIDAGCVRTRRPERGLLGGVCAGVAEAMDVDVLVVRLVMAVLMFAAGVGVAVYALAWASSPSPPGGGGAAREHGAWRDAVVIVLLVGAVLFGLRRVGLWLGDGIIWPCVLGGCGLALVWRPTVALSGSSSERPRSPRELLRRLGERRSPAAGDRRAAGSSRPRRCCTRRRPAQPRRGDRGGRVVATISGCSSPVVVRVGRSLASERAARIREQERAELAAHLHDSVLQTLALIQSAPTTRARSRGSPAARSASCAAGCYARPPGERRDSSRGAERTPPRSRSSTASRSRSSRRRPPLDGPLDAIVQAAREAMINAAKFAGGDADRRSTPRSTGERVEIFVRTAARLRPRRDPRRPSRRARLDHRAHGAPRRQRGLRSAPGEGTEVGS